MKTGLRDLVLPIVVIAVVGTMILPLPRYVLDTLLVANIAFALCLLASSVYVTEPARFTSLPAMLLIATVIRLGLNISTTRQLLAHGEAPQIINAFGNFVVSGNLIVGIVIFIIVTIVQFIVIAKGAERIAEVSARFTLDAMPGKQMSIDADIRAGLLSVVEAKEKRKELQQESKLYGALDGAMKFVKGDAIAGLLITLVNISGGLVVGVSQQNLSLAQAIQKYTLFTIGDGLVSQIPALFVSVAAAIVITRVQGVSDTFLGRDLINQLAEQPQALLTTGFVLILLAMLPGFPSISLLLLGLVFLTFFIIRRAQQKLDHQEESYLQLRPAVNANIKLKLTRNALQLLQKQGGFNKLIAHCRAKLFETNGIVLPEIQLEIIEERAQAHMVEIAIQDVVTKSLDIDSTQLETFFEIILKLLLDVIEAEKLSLIDDSQTRLLIETHHRNAEDLINAVIPAVLSTTGVTLIIRELVREGMPINDFRGILQGIAESHLRKERGEIGQANIELTALKSQIPIQIEHKHNELQDMLADVRVALMRTVQRLVSKNGKSTAGYILNAEIDTFLAKSSLTATPIKPELIENIQQQLNKIAQTAHTPILIFCSRYARAKLANLFIDNRNVSVFSVAELSPALKVNILGELVMPVEVGTPKPNADKVTYLQTRMA